LGFIVITRLLLSEKTNIRLVPKLAIRGKINKVIKKNITIGGQSKLTKK